MSYFLYFLLIILPLLLSFFLFWLSLVKWMASELILFGNMDQGKHIGGEKE